MNLDEFGERFDQLPDAVVLIDGVGTLRAANVTTEQRYGWTRDEWMGRSLLDLVHPDDLEWAVSSLGTVTDRNVGTPIELRIQSTEGWRLVEVVGRSIDIEGDSCILIAARDLTERRRWEVAGDDTELLRTVLQNAASLTLLTDRGGVIQAVSAALIRLTGFGPDATIGRNLTELVAENDRTRLERSIAATAQREHGNTTLEASLLAVGRPAVPCQLTIVNLLDDPTVEGLVVSGHDISELWQTRKELEHMARHDPLTGLPNRTQLSRFLGRSIEETVAGGPGVIVAFIDLDRFKPVNDLYGHESGDDLLVTVAARLRDAVRDEDLVARFGGDEFVVVANGRGIEAADLVGRLNDTLSGPFHLSVGVVHISASIGVVRAGAGDDVDTVLAEADNAMYAVKNDLKHTVASTRTVAARRQLADRITQAFEMNEFEVHYQPIVELETGEWTSLEAVARWRHHEQGLLLPSDFLDIVEDIGLGIVLGETVVDAVGSDLERLRLATGATPSVAVNASADEMTSPEYPAMISSALERWQVGSERLTIEISERSILGRGGRTSRAIPANLASLAEAGVSIAVDDFGTGYSSLTHLVTFPIDRIKIDRSFVTGLVADSQRRSVIAALIGLAESTNMSVVAEGIDHADQVAVLRTLGCRLGQGFHYAAPMPYDDLEAALRTADPAAEDPPS
ncbi:MAG: EAL domain-containing protein [Actinomycetia bacterium]|nr:EAL domain-containing protein [Actinomycetes bacterium]MCP4963093.1 EAL domain-containing protein [Actinomycetes bacterium]